MTDLHCDPGFQQQPGTVCGLWPDLTLQQVCRIVHPIWLGSCEYPGPVKTDRMFAGAIGEVEKKDPWREVLTTGLL